MKLIDQLKRFLAPVKRKVQMLIGVGSCDLVDDSGDLQEIQASFLLGEVRPNLVRLQQFGFSGVPSNPNEAGCVALFPNGDRSQGVVIALEQGTVRQNNLAPGDSVHYDSRGNKSHFKSGEYEVIHASKIIIQAPNVEIIGPTLIDGNVNIQGTLTVSGAVTSLASITGLAIISGAGGVSDATGSMQNMRSTFNIHNHGGSSGNPPNVTM